MLSFACSSPIMPRSRSSQDKKIKREFESRPLQDYLAEFDRLEKKYPGPIPSSIQISLGENPLGKKLSKSSRRRQDLGASLDLEQDLGQKQAQDQTQSLSQSQKGSLPHLVIGCLMHGDETGSLPPALEAIHLLESKQAQFSGILTVFLGNRKAAELNKRYFEQDLNRVFHDQAPDSHEKRRAKEMMPLLLSADLLIDLHQTIEPTDRAFYTFAFDEVPYEWAKYLEGAEFLATRSKSEGFAPGTLSGVEFATHAGVPSLTLEASQKGISKEAFDRDLKVILRAITALNQIGKDKSLSSIRKLSKKSKELTLLKRVAHQSFTHPKMRLNSGWKNFSHVTRGEAIGLNADGSDLTALETGYLLFPKYPARNEKGEAIPPLPSDLYFLLQEARMEEFS